MSAAVFSRASTKLKRHVSVLSLVVRVSKRVASPDLEREFVLQFKWCDDFKIDDAGGDGADAALHAFTEAGGFGQDHVVEVLGDGGAEGGADGRSVAVDFSGRELAEVDVAR